MPDEPEQQPNTISGLPTAETPPGQLPEPEETGPSPLPVPNPPGANPPHQSVTTPVQYPPYERVSAAPAAGQAPAAPAPAAGQFVGQVDPPDAMESVDRPEEEGRPEEEQGRPDAAPGSAPEPTDFQMDGDEEGP